MPGVRHHLKNHFVPHTGNEHHPHVLRHHVLFGYSAILLAVKAIGLAAAVVLPSLQVSASPITAERIVSLTNAARQAVELPALTMNAKLSQAARAKAEDMALNQYFAHTSPAGLTPWHWIKSAGYAYKVSAENLAVHFSEAEDVQSGWMQSPTHKQNIVDPRFTEIGVGIATADFEGAASTFVVEMFGQPKVMAPTAVATAPIVEEKQEAPKELPAVVKPTNEGYSVELTAAKNTANATVQIGKATVPLVRDPVKPSTWVATVPVEEPSPAPTPVEVTIQDTRGHEEAMTVAIVTPRSNLEEAFSLPAGAHVEPTVVGSLSMEGLQQIIRTFFILFILFLLTSLVIGLGYRLHLHNAPAIAHTAVVLSLAVFLYTFT